MKLKAFLTFWDTDVRPPLIAALKLMPAEKWDYTPVTGLMTFRQQTLHIADAEVGWLMVAEKVPFSDWPEFPVADYPTPEAALTLLDETHARTIEVLSSKPATWVDEMRHSPWDDKFTVEWILYHVLEHEIHHRAQLFLHLRLNGIEPPRY